MNCTQKGCTHVVTVSLVWPGTGRVFCCTEHYGKICEVARMLGLPYASLDIQPFLVEANRLHDGLDDVRETIIAIEAMRPHSKCNGGPHGVGWCGKLATVVCTQADGLQWYACDDAAHQEGAKTERIAEWFARLDARREREQ
jgi:hypothetical protein